LSEKDVELDKKLDNVINNVEDGDKTSVKESNEMNQIINDKYLNCLDKALEIFSFHKTTNYILVIIGSFLIFWGVLYGAYVEYVEQQKQNKQIPNEQGNSTNSTSGEKPNEQVNRTPPPSGEKPNEQVNRTPPPSGEKPNEQVNRTTSTSGIKQYTLENNGFYSVAGSESMLNSKPSVTQIQVFPLPGANQGTTNTTTTGANPGTTNTTTTGANQGTTNTTTTGANPDRTGQIRNPPEQNPETTKEPDSSNSHWLSLLSTGSGLALLVTSFFYKSQKYAQQSITNLAIINIVFKSHYTNHIITRILIQLRLIEVKEKWPKRNTEIDIIKQQVESLRKNERKFSSKINESSATSDVPFELPPNDTSTVPFQPPTSETSNVNSDPLVSLLGLIETMTAQTERHITLLQKANMDNIKDK
jgi:hypothetical protein